MFGVVGFDPNDVVKNTAYQAPISITKFEKYEEKDKKLKEQTQQLLETKKIILQPSDRFFRLNISLKDYFNTKKVRYSYKVKGVFEEDQLVNGNIIEIGGLPYGRHMLIIRGQGADRRFSTEELTIPLIVVRPFYLRWWFILLALVTLGISGFQIYQWRVRQLKDRKRELELLVKQRTAKIQEQAQQLKELDELKSKFFANISHELRTPLTLILAPLDNLLQQKTNSNKEFTYLSMMQQNGKKLLKRINELLDLSRLDANRLEVNEVPTFLYPFFKTLLSTFESAANLKGVQLLFDYHLDEHIQVLLDDDKVEKIVANFLSNALKFTPKNGTIKLKIEKRQQKLRVSVSDTGIGILPSDLIKIFDRFYQTKNTKQQGTGIGLSLCRELAKVLGGSVWATSKIEKGSIFYLELPLVETFAQKIAVEEEIVAITPIPEIIPKENSLTKSFRPTLLIVEDNADLRNYLILLLKEEYNIFAVENGQLALDYLKRATPNLIISDIMMPVMDGIELLTNIKQTPALQQIPMILLTARQSLDVKIEALRIGVDDYLTKPFKEKELKARIANLIKNSQNRTNIQPVGKSTQKINTAKSASTADLKWLEKIEQIILANLSKPNYKLSDTATEMAVSYRRMQQKIKTITGLTPKQYQRSIKLNRARQLLKSGAFQTVTEVMYQLGFEHHHYFSKIYKEEFGIMPSEELN